MGQQLMQAIHSNNKKESIMIKSKQLAQIILCLSLLIPASKAAAQEVFSARFTPGYNIYVYSLKLGTSISDLPLPNAELGYFTAEKPLYQYRDVAKLLEISPRTMHLIRGIGYINIEKPTTVIFLANSDGRVAYALYANKKLITKEFTVSGLANSSEITFSKPGIYELDFRIYGTINQNKEIKEELYPYHDFHFKIKTEDSSKPLPAYSVLLLPLKQ